MRLLLSLTSLRSLTVGLGRLAVCTPPPSGRLGGASSFLFALSVKNISKNAWIIGWKIVTLHAFSEFKHIKIVE